MTEVERLFERQARWQRQRQALSWPEKIRLAERMRATAEAFRRQRLQRLAPAPPERSRPNGN
jgi:hypothetical protein